jgi:DeoR family suf operon transcriptional repressor
MPSITRDTILRSIRAQRECTVKELAESVGISPVSVRHHLTNLQAEGLIAVKEVRQGVGRPHHTFSLTDRALELFPSRYFSLTNRLLDEIKDSMSKEKVEEIFSSIASGLAESLAAQLKDLPLEERFTGLVERLSEEGFDGDIEHQGDKVLIRELSCPYLQLARQHREVCLFDKAFIATALSLPVERVTHITNDDFLCAFSISLSEEAQ